MATALTSAAGPLAEGDGLSRWQLRADSIDATVRALTRVWGEVAASARGGRLDEPLRDQVRGDPRLAGRLDESREVRIRTRTSVLTLVVVAEAPETLERATAAVGALAGRHPSRAIVLSPTDPDGPSSFEAQIAAACRLPQRSTSEVCTEEIIIRVGGELSAHLASTVAPLLIHDLPVVLWWPDDVPFERRDFLELVGECDRLLVDSGTFRGDGCQRLRSLGETIVRGQAVLDVSWMRQMLWRELLAACFDHPLLTPELRAVARVRIDVARPLEGVRLSRALLFAGWLMARLGWTVASPLAAADDGTWTGRLRSGRRDVEIGVRPVSVDFDGPVRAPGSLVRVELESSRSGSSTRVRVTRRSDHLLATADWNGAQVIRRATPLESFDEMPFLAEALDRTGHDRLYEAAMRRAVSLAGEGEGT